MSDNAPFYDLRDVMTDLDVAMVALAPVFAAGIPPVDSRLGDDAPVDVAAAFRKAMRSEPDLCVRVLIEAFKLCAEVRRRLGINSREEPTP